MCTWGLNSLVTITEGVRTNIFWGNTNRSLFDLISLSFFAILFILEICYLTMDLFNDANDNMVILLPRYGKKHIIYKDILIKMILRDCIVVVSDYLFFLFVEHTSNGLEDFKVIFMLLIEIFHLQMISYLFSFWKDSIIGYIVAFIVFFRRQYRKSHNLDETDVLFFDDAVLHVDEDTQRMLLVVNCCFCAVPDPVQNHLHVYVRSV